MVLKKDARNVVREGYGKIARNGSIYDGGSTISTCCSGKDTKVISTSSCCNPKTVEEVAMKIGYSKKDILNLPEGSNLGLGCGNPVAFASLTTGETVLDLGSGAGVDCFIASKKVGISGRVIGVDMTSEMLEKARDNARRGKYTNVEFRLGEIENLPVADSTIDAIISNCVINLSPDKQRVFREAFRVLKPGGRLMVSDLVILKPLLKKIQNSVAAYIGCVAGAMLKAKYLDAIKKAGFGNIKVLSEKKFPPELMLNDSTAQAIVNETRVDMKVAMDIARIVVSISVWAEKPKK